jgi:hypothetical protein
MKGYARFGKKASRGVVMFSLWPGFVERRDPD